MSYYIYKTVNTINNKVYIGVHKTENPMDSYLGSGKLLKQAIKKYGKNNFKKFILEKYDLAEDAFKKEAEIVTEEFVKSSNTYNLCTGGCGGSRNTGRRFSKEIRDNMSRAAKKRSTNPEFKQKMSNLHKGKVISEKHKIAISRALKGKSRVFSDSHLKNLEDKRFSGKTHKQESKDIIRKKNKSLKWTYNPHTNEQKRRPKNEPLPDGWIYGRRPKLDAL
jgi:group I intron endonuclease